jgi:hypothetical protein
MNITSTTIGLDDPNDIRPHPTLNMIHIGSTALVILNSEAARALAVHLLNIRERMYVPTPHYTEDYCHEDHVALTGED